MLPKKLSVFQDLLIRGLLLLRNECAIRCLQSEIFWANSSELWCDELNCDVCPCLGEPLLVVRARGFLFHVGKNRPPRQCAASWVAGTVRPRYLRNFLTCMAFKLRTPNVKLIVTTECMDCYEFPRRWKGESYNCLKWALSGF